MLGKQGGYEYEAQIKEMMKLYNLMKLRITVYTRLFIKIVLIMILEWNQGGSINMEQNNRGIKYKNDDSSIFRQLLKN